MRRLIGEMVDAKRRTSDEKWMPRVTMTMRNARGTSFFLSFRFPAFPYSAHYFSAIPIDSAPLAPSADCFASGRIAFR